jgi:flagellar motility protein MotE (MotC chaperone)
MFKKKMLMQIGLIVGAFLVINVGMYFFLNATQPKIGARGIVAHAGGKGADSTAANHAEAKTDTAKHELAAQHDSVKAEEKPAAAVMAAIGGTEPTATESPKPEPVAVKTEAPKTEAVAEQTPAAPESTPAKSAPEVVTPQSAAAAVKNGDSEQIAKLAKLLESLKPDEAAGIAADLNTDQIVALVMRMKDRTAGKMLAAMPGDQAAKVAAKMSQSVTANRGRS